MELIVPIYNINWGYNKEMLGKSDTLYGYAFFVDSARQYVKAGYKLEEAIRRAAKDCIEKGIEKGVAKGIEQGKFEVARKMLSRKMSVSDIIDITGLNEKDILSL